MLEFLLPGSGAMVEQGALPVVAPEVPELIPARMLNEFCYCPRLAYLEWVQGEFRDNLETVEGRFGHRRVDVAGERQGKAESRKRKAEGQRAAESGKPGGRGGFWSAVVGAEPRSEEKRQSHVESDTPLEDDAGSDDSHPSPSDSSSPLSAFRPPLSSPVHARSLMLSAPIEGLIARMDVLELDGDVATPVDYKRGKVPAVRGGAWEPERVQLCAQGLILREAGYRCDRGMLYFVESRRRVEVLFDDALVRRTRELIAQFRISAAAPQAPPPLVDSPKCPRCSLVGICLPDEVHLLRQQESGKPNAESGEGGGAEDSAATTSSSAVRSPLSASKSPLRNLVPARDDTLPLYVSEQGAYVGKDGERLTVKVKDRTLCEVRLMAVSQVCVFGNVQLSSQALRELTGRGVPVCYFSYGGWFEAMTTGLMHKNVDLRRRQFAVAADAAASLELARRFVMGKIKNCRTLLRRNLPEKGGVCLARLAEFHGDACAGRMRRNAAGHRGNGGQDVLRPLRADDQRLSRVRPERPQPPPSFGPGQLPAELPLCAADEGPDGHAASRGVRPDAGVLPSPAVRPAVAGARPD